MFKRAKIMFLYTETSVHAGSGTSLGTIDLPIQREKYTDFPIIQASGVKGGIREWFDLTVTNGTDKRRIDLTFGPEKIGTEESGFAAAITFTDARILLFPVRSLKGIFAYCTSPTILERLRRDAEIAGVKIPWEVPVPPDDQSLLGVASGCNVAERGIVLLEEYAFKFQADDTVSTVADWISKNVFPSSAGYEFWREKVKKSLLVLPDDAFRDFVRLCTEVQARIKINNETRTVEKGGLFYEEALLPDSVLFSLILAHDPVKDDCAELADVDGVIRFMEVIDGKRLQLGGDATIGRGIISVRLYEDSQRQPREGTNNG